MILSFHPCFVADWNLNCAGRRPGSEDLEAIKKASAVILPQGCSKLLYQLASQNCRHVFPNYDARFAYPDKTGQIELFRQRQVAFPRTETFVSLDAFNARYGNLRRTPFRYPFVFKFAWGGEGDHVHRIDSFSGFEKILMRVMDFERTGQHGFLLQEYVHSDNRSLRVVTVGERLISYWRIQKDPQHFQASVKKGASIDTEADSDLQMRARAAVKGFSGKTGINLAGFDLLFASEPGSKKERMPLFLEINYFFGRQGLGGSEKYYNLLTGEIERWLAGLGLAIGL
jgi:ribosomal protein S6--L-glutamate ligase